MKRPPIGWEGGYEVCGIHVTIRRWWVCASLVKRGTTYDSPRTLLGGPRLFLSWSEPSWAFGVRPSYGFSGVKAGWAIDFGRLSLVRRER